MRTVLFVVLGAAALFFGILLLMILILIIAALCVDPRKEYPRNSRFYRFLLNTATAWMVLFLRIRVNVTGLDAVPPTGRFLFVGNHRSNFDPIIAWHVLKEQNVAFLSKEANFHIPVFGRIIRRCCFMAVDREHPLSSAKTFRKAAALLKAEEVSIGVYPEGTRNRAHGLLPFHNGVFRIAKEANVPIVIGAMQGTDRIRSRTPWKKTTVEVRFSVIPAEQVAALSPAELGDVVSQKLTIF